MELLRRTSAGGTGGEAAMASGVSPVSMRGRSAPTLTVVEGNSNRVLSLAHSPFTIGRRPGKDLVISDPRASRDHAEIIEEPGGFTVIDLNSRHGTFVNGTRVERQRLRLGDRIEFGGTGGPHAVFGKETDSGRSLLTELTRLERPPGAASDLEKLTVFLDIVRKLSSSAALDEILSAIIEATLRLTHAERGYIFLRRPDGSVYLAAARDRTGNVPSDSTVSHSIVQDAIDSAVEFLVSDTHSNTAVQTRQSIVAFDLRTVIAVPLRDPKLRAKRAEEVPAGSLPTMAVLPPMGVLYLDSRLATGNLSSVSADILRAIATEAAAAVSTARLAEAEEEARRYEQELAIAAGMQQRLMAVSIPNLEFVRIRARSQPCQSIGGDFFDVVVTPRGLAAVVTDVSGKGVSAAILASTLQGLIYSQLVADLPLSTVASSVNRYLCEKTQGEGYATMVIMLVHPDGATEYVNCGHLAPLVVSGQRVTSLAGSNLPVGLFAGVGYDSATLELRGGDAVLLFTDGVTEAEDASGEFFGDQRLTQLVQEACPSADESLIDCIIGAVDRFRGRVALRDDCTAVELKFAGQAKFCPVAV